MVPPVAAKGTDEQVIVEGTEAQEPVEAAEQGFDEEGEAVGGGYGAAEKRAR